MSMNYKMITTVGEVTQLSPDATIFVNDAGELKQAKVALFPGGSGSADPAALHFRGVCNSLPTELSGYADGDVVLVGEKEYVLYSGAWYEFGDVGTSGIGDIEEITADEISEIFGSLSL